MIGYAAWLTAIGTVGALVVALFGYLLRGKPKLAVALRYHEGTNTAYWHETKLPTGTNMQILFKQLRIWVSNEGSKEGKNCRAKMRIIQPNLEGRDSPMEFTLPAFLYNRPIMDTTWGYLAAPSPSQVSVDVSAKSREAFELLYHKTGTPSCHPYSLATFPLNPGTRYQRKVRAYADDAPPSVEETFKFEWDGVEDSLSTAIR